MSTYVTPFAGKRDTSGRSGVLESVKVRQLAGTDRRLQFDVFGQTLRAEFASDAGLLESAERSGGVERVHVDAERAGAYLLSDVQAMGDICRPHRSTQAVVAVVGDAD